MPAEVETDATPAGRHFEPNSVTGTLIVALVLCLVCSLVVSVSAVALKPAQDANKQNKMKRNVLIAAGIWDPQKNTDKDIPELFKSIETIEVQLPQHAGGSAATGRGSVTDNAPELTGNFAEENAENENIEAGSVGPVATVSIPPDLDVAGIKQRPVEEKIYLVKGTDGKVESIVLPIFGKGLWSTLYGFLALKADGRTAQGITFYQHGETPGLGGEVDNPGWKAKWPGKELVDDKGQPVIDVTKPGYANAAYEIDGLSGATITSGGVENTLRYWLGSDGFGPWLEKYREGKLAMEKK